MRTGFSGMGMLRGQARSNLLPCRNADPAWICDRCSVSALQVVELMESQNGSSTRSGSSGTGRPSGRCRGGDRRRVGFRVEPNLERRHRPAGLDRDAERQQEPILKVGVGQEQDHGDDLVSRHTSR